MYAGASVATSTGTRPTSTPSSRSTTSSPSVTCPISMHATSQRSKSAATSATCSRFAITSIRSWLSESMTS